MRSSAPLGVTELGSDFVQRVSVWGARVRACAAFGGGSAEGSDGGVLAPTRPHPAHASGYVMSGDAFFSQLC